MEHGLQVNILIQKNKSKLWIVETISLQLQIFLCISIFVCVFHTFTSDFCVFLYIYICFLCISIHLHLIFCVFFFIHLNLIFVLVFLFVLEWVSDCCLTSSQQIILAISWRKEVNFQLKWWWGPLCTRSTRRDRFVWC